MSHLMMLVLALLAATVQVAVLPVLAASPLAVPLLPVALLAAWCVMRRPTETWPVLLVTPMLLGPLSEEQFGWFLVALLPAAAVGTLLSPIDAPGPPPGLGHQLALVALVAAVGAAGHAAILATAGGVPGNLVHDAGAIAGSLAWTVIFAFAMALVLAPLRPRPRGLFA